MADFIFELAAFECRDVGTAGAGTHTGSALVVVVEVIIDKATSSPGQLFPPYPTGLRTRLLATSLAFAGSDPGS
jgi:hypothetical protein